MNQLCVLCRLAWLAVTGRPVLVPALACHPRWARIATVRRPALGDFSENSYLFPRSLR